MAHWKEWVKRGLLAWQRRKYDWLLEKKTRVYDSWIRDMEAERYGDDGPGIGSGAVSVRQVPYDVCQDYLMEGAMGADRADVVLFVGRNGRVSDIAEKAAAEFFAQNEGTDLAYGDEDVMGPDGIRYTPWFKPDWSPDTFLSFFYFGNVFAVRMRALRALTEEEMGWIWQPREKRRDSGEGGRKQGGSHKNNAQSSYQNNCGKSNGKSGRAIEMGIYRLCYVLAVKCGGFLVRSADRTGFGFPIGHMDEVLFHAKENCEIGLVRSQPLDLLGCPVGGIGQCGYAQPGGLEDGMGSWGNAQPDGQGERIKNWGYVQPDGLGERIKNWGNAQPDGLGEGIKNWGNAQPGGLGGEIKNWGYAQSSGSEEEIGRCGYSQSVSCADGIDNSEYSRHGAKLSIVIPSKDNAEALKNCIRAVRAQYERRANVLDCEIIVVDNGSAEEVQEELDRWLAAQDEGIRYLYLYRKMPFHFSRMCNIGAEAATGDVLLFLNDDVEMVAEEDVGAGQKADICLLERLYGRARRSFTGAVGVKLYYPGSRRIQHAGVVNLRLGPVHKLQFKEDDTDYFYGWNRRERNVAAVTGACLAVERKKYREAGGLPEELPVAFNDVDFCFTLFEKGYYNVVLQDVVLYHYESMSRGRDDDRGKLERLLGEKDRMYARHPQMYGKDPFYHKYLAGDMLSTGFELRADYDGEPQEAYGKIREEKGLLKNAREDACVIVSLEYAGMFRDFKAEDETAMGVAGEKDSGRGYPMLRALKDGKGTGIGKGGAFGIRKKKDTAYLLQGYSFVAGSDNARYEKYLIFRQDNGAGGRGVFSVKAEPFVRKDVEGNLPDQTNVGMTGFCVLIGREDLPLGAWQAGVMVKDKCSGQKLYTWTNRYLAGMG